MRAQTIKNLLILFSLVFYLPILNSHTLEKAISSNEREAKNILRDSYRNPYETLSFFEIKSDMKIVELSPGGGWYTEIPVSYTHLTLPTILRV